LAFNAKDNLPLCNVFRSMPHYLGLEINTFRSNAVTIRGLAIK